MSCLFFSLLVGSVIVEHEVLVLIHRSGKVLLGFPMRNIRSCSHSYSLEFCPVNDSRRAPYYITGERYFLLLGTPLPLGGHLYDQVKSS